MTLLVGVDPGRRSSAVVQLAAMLARSAGTDLVVAAIVSSWAPSLARVDQEWRDRNREAADLVLDHAASVLGGEVAARYLLHEASSPRRGLLELADAHRTDLIVVGSSADGAPGRISLGSVSEALLHTSPVPVAIAPNGFRAPSDARVARVTAAYGGSDAAADLVVGAAAVTAQVGARLRLASFAVRPQAEIGIISGAGARSEDPVIGEWAAQVRAHADGVIAEVEALRDHPGAIETVVGVGESWTAAIDDVGWDAEDVLVVGSSSLGPLARVFVGSHATKVVRHSPVPTVVVPRRAAEELAERAEA